MGWEISAPVSDGDFGLYPCRSCGQQFSADDAVFGSSERAWDVVHVGCFVRALAQWFGGHGEGMREIEPDHRALSALGATSELLAGFQRALLEDPDNLEVVRMKAVEVLATYFPLEVEEEPDA